MPVRGGYQKLVQHSDNDTNKPSYKSISNDDDNDWWRDSNGRTYTAPPAACITDEAEYQIELTDYDVEEGDRVGQLQLSNRRSGKRAGAQASEAPAQFVEREVAQGDSLQGLALQYRCTVSELKRLNKLIQDVDFHALARIKIPVKPFSALSEILLTGEDHHHHHHHQVTKSHSWSDMSQITAAASPSTSLHLLSSSHTSNGHLVRTGSMDDLCVDGEQLAPPASKPGSPRTFLKQLDQNLAQIIDKSQQQRSSELSAPAGESVNCLIAAEEPGLGVSTEFRSGGGASPAAYDGAACGITWFSALALVLFVGLLVPLTFYLYYEYHSE